ncbi:hypothetical protein, partial [Parablautia muri]
FFHSLPVISLIKAIGKLSPRLILQEIFFQILYNKESLPSIKFLAYPHPLCPNRNDSFQTQAD